MDTSDRPGRAAVVDTPKGPMTTEAVRAAVLARLADQTHWDQTAWAWWVGPKAPTPGCGTSHCLAGWACVEAGFELYWVPLPDHAGCSTTWSAFDVAGGAGPIGDVAATLLGLSQADSSYLFAGNRTLEEITDCFDALDRGEICDHADDPAPF